MINKILATLILNLLDLNESDYICEPQHFNQRKYRNVLFNIHNFLKVRYGCEPVQKIIKH
jgi:hypothetical protein